MWRGAGMRILLVGGGGLVVAARHHAPPGATKHSEGSDGLCADFERVCGDCKSNLTRHQHPGVLPRQVTCLFEGGVLLRPQSLSRPGFGFSEELPRPGRGCFRPAPVPWSHPALLAALRRAAHQAAVHLFTSQPECSRSWLMI
jgi:hypothetical protein